MAPGTTPGVAGSTLGYTGHEHLERGQLGLILAGARVYDPTLGVFLSPDPTVQAPYDSQGTQRYAYAFNNPLRYTDPSGYTAIPQTDSPLLSNPGTGAGGVYGPGRGWVIAAGAYLAAIASGDPSMASNYPYLDNGSFADGARIVEHSVRAHSSTSVQGVSFADMAFAGTIGPSLETEEEGRMTVYGKVRQNELLGLGVAALAHFFGVRSPAALWTVRAIIVYGPRIGARLIPGLGFVLLAADAGMFLYDHRDAIGAIMSADGSAEQQAQEALGADDAGSGQDKPPPGTRGIDQTDWSGDHKDIKGALGLGARDKVLISPNGDVWVETPDGRYVNEGPAGAFTGSGEPSGRRGVDRDRRR